jgi:Ca2+-binding RTX toxin-like protein
MMAGLIDFSLNALFPINTPPNSPVEDGWDEGEDLIISKVTVTENGIPATGGIPGVWFTWKFENEFNTANFFELQVPIGQDPNVTIPWSEFVAAGIDNGQGFIRAYLSAHTSDGPIPGATDETSILLENAAPSISGFEVSVVQSLTASADACGDAGSSDVSLSAIISDPSPTDEMQSLSYIVDWGDAAPPDLNNSLLRTPVAAGTLDLIHSYAVAGNYSVTLYVFDEASRSETAPQEVAVGSGGAGSVSLGADGTLVISGSEIGDFVHVSAPSGVIRVEADFLCGPDQFVEFPAADVDQIQARLGDGDDVFSVAGSVSLPIIVVGGAGDDLLMGGAGRSILIGGAGIDMLFGGRGEDVLIGGTTDHDSNSAALLALLAEWSSADSFAVRVANLTNGGGLNGLFVLNGSTVHDDSEMDILMGGQNADWLFVLSDTDMTLGARRDLVSDFS